MVSLHEDKRKDKAQRAHTCWNPEGHMAESFGDFSKFYIRPPVSVFLLYLMLDGLVLFCKGDFRHVRCL